MAVEKTIVDTEDSNLMGRSRRKKTEHRNLVPIAGGEIPHKRHSELYNGRVLVADGEVDSMPAAERFRILRARIERQNLGSDRASILAVTSAVPEEGKSMISVNLARALSVDPVAKVLLIDCDFRRPTVHEYFNLSRGPGLSDALVSRKSLNSIIQPVSRGLDFIAAGSPLVDPALAVEQPVMERFLYELKKYYRYIIIDCPPVLLCPEPITITTIVEGTLLVVRGWRTEKRLVHDAVDIIGKDKIMGVVMNDGMDNSKQYRYYRYYDQKYPDSEERAKNSILSDSAARLAACGSKVANIFRSSSNAAEDISSPDVE